MSRSNGTKSGVNVVVPLRERVEEALDRLSRLLVEHAGRELTKDVNGRSASPLADAERAQRTVRFLGQVAAAWSHLPEAVGDGEGAGFGSTVLVEDLDRGVRETFTLMAGALLDLDAGQVSLASPMGQALAGARPGDVVRVRTPQRDRRLRVVSVRTLHDLLNEVVLAV